MAQNFNWNQNGELPAEVLQWEDPVQYQQKYGTQPAQPAQWDPQQMEERIATRLRTELDETVTSLRSDVSTLAQSLGEFVETVRPQAQDPYDPYRQEPAQPAPKRGGKRSALEEKVDLLLKQNEQQQRETQQTAHMREVAQQMQEALDSSGFTGYEEGLYKPDPNRFRQNPDAEATRFLAALSKKTAASARVALQYFRKNAGNDGAQNEPVAAGAMNLNSNLGGGPVFETGLPGNGAAPNIVDKLNAMSIEDLDNLADTMRRRAARGEIVRPQDLV